MLATAAHRTASPKTKKAKRVWMSVVIMAAVVATLVVSVHSAEATFPGNNGRIAFTGVLEPSDSEIFVMDFVTDPSADSTPTNLTNNEMEDSGPAWSPGGGEKEKIAYASYLPVNDGSEPVSVGSDIFTMNATDGLEQNKLLENPADDSEPAWSPDGTKIAFSGSIGEDEFAGDIFVADADGTNLKQLTNDRARDASPSWSPKGNKIAFQRNEDIFVMRADGSRPGINLTDTPRGAAEGEPAWSPDGSKIAYVVFSSSGEREDFDIYVMNSDGSGKKQLTSGARTYDDHPAWSPDGSKIAFTRSGDIFMMNAQGGEQRRFASDPGAFLWGPAWSPDGSKIAFTNSPHENYEIFSADPQGTEPEPVPTNLTNSPAFDWNPAWAPDGEKIAFSSSEGWRNEDVFVMDDQGGEPTNLTNSPRASDFDPAWSPDGERIIFSRANRKTSPDIYVMNADGSGEPRQLTSSQGAEFQPVWSPNGKKIAFVRYGAKSWTSDIWVMNPNGNGQENLTKTGTRADRFMDEISPDWSPNAKRIVFANVEDQFLADIAVMNADGTRMKEITEGRRNWDSDPVWSPDGKKIAFSRYGARSWTADIFAMNPDGSGVQRIIKSPADEFAPDWQPLSTE